MACRPLRPLASTSGVAAKTADIYRALPAIISVEPYRTFSDSMLSTTCLHALMSSLWMWHESRM
jgi:hypothetical protein